MKISPCPQCGEYVDIRIAATDAAVYMMHNGKKASFAWYFQFACRSGRCKRWPEWGDFYNGDEPFERAVEYMIDRWNGVAETWIKDHKKKEAGKKGNE